MAYQPPRLQRKTLTAKQRASVEHSKHHGGFNAGRHESRPEPVIRVSIRVSKSWWECYPEREGFTEAAQRQTERMASSKFARVDWREIA